MQPLKTYHGPSHSLFIETVIVGVVLFQWQYQSLFPAICFGFRVSSVNLGVSGCCNVEQLNSPDHHPMHLKGVVVFCKSEIPHHLNTVMVVSPTWPGSCCQSFSVEPPVQRLPMLSLQEASSFYSDTSFKQFVPSLHLCLSMWLQRLCPHQNWPHSPLMSLS